MTDRYFSLTVLLEEPMRDDDAETIVTAIKQLRGVKEVRPHVATTEFYMAQRSAKIDVLRSLIELLKDELKT